MFGLATPLGLRRDKHAKNLEAIYAGPLHWKVFIPSHGHWK